MAGVTPTGFVKKTFEQIVDEVNQQQRDEISQALILTTDTSIGQLNAIEAEREASLWDALQAVYSAFDPNQASGVALEAVSAITGTIRNAATVSNVYGVSVNLNAATTLPQGSIASVAGDPSRRFITKTAVTNSGGSAATVTVDFESQDTGPVECLAGQLTVIAEPVTGWNSVTNGTDAVIGAVVESDPDLRIRRNDELAGGSTTADAIRVDLLKLTGVIFCRVLLNDTDVTDANGLPPHSFEPIVYGPTSPTTPDNQAVVDQIRKSKAAGIRSYGSSSLTSLDSQGNVYNIGYTRPTTKNIYLEIDVTTDDTYPADGDTQVAEAIAAYGDENYLPGDDVIVERLKAAAFTVTGVTDVTALRAGLSASPVTTANIAIALREVASLDTGRILVTST